MCKSNSFFISGQHYNVISNFDYFIYLLKINILVFCFHFSVCHMQAADVLNPLSSCLTFGNPFKLSVYEYTAGVPQQRGVGFISLCLYMQNYHFPAISHPPCLYSCTQVSLCPVAVFFFIFVLIVSFSVDAVTIIIFRHVHCFHLCVF